MPERGGAFWHTIVGALTEAVVVRDHEGTVLFVNAAAERLSGLPAEEVVGTKIGLRADRAIDEHGMPLPVEHLPAARVLQTGVAVTNQIVGIHSANGALRWLAVGAAPVPLNGAETPDGVVTTALDVTDRVVGEQTLRESEARFRASIGSMLDGFVLYRAQRDENGEIVDLVCEYANDATIANGGFAPEEQIGRGMLEIAPESGEEGNFEMYVRVIETGEPAVIEVPFYESDRTVGAFEMRVTKFGDGCVFVFRDVTERSRATTELRRSNEQLAEFATIAAHDLAEPLRGLTGFAELLDREYGEHLDDEAKRWLDYIEQGADRMRLLIDDLLVYAKAGGDQPEFRPVDLDAVAVEARASLAAVLRDTGGTLELDKLPVVDGNPTQLLQLLQNLLGNALKFARPGVPPQIRVDAEHESDFVRLQVTDNGIGVPATESERIFAPFHRAHVADGRPGTGLGLAICSRLVERHGGRIWVEPAPGGVGSRFCVTLPTGERR